MPVLKIQTNVSLNQPEKAQILGQLSTSTAKLLGKPERYVMIVLETDVSIQFAANRNPAIFAELKSIGLPENQTGDISSALCSALTELLKVPADRIYIEFSNAERHLWGWNGATF
jgi:phenylpyruvate tautomerase PptA (4-oxalocrotonate tautomerase family)